MANFIEYQNDEQFTREILRHIPKLKKRVAFYRKLSDVQKAKFLAKLWRILYHNNSHASELKMIDMLDRDEVLQKIRKTRALWHSKSSMQQMKHYSKYDTR